MRSGLLVRVLGGLFIALGAANLAALLLPEVREQLASPAAVAVRYALMVVYGLGLALLRKWGVYLWLFAILLNWSVYYAVYDGAGAIVPLWLSMLVPVLVGMVFYTSWGALK